MPKLIKPLEATSSLPDISKPPWLVNDVVFMKPSTASIEFGMKLMKLFEALDPATCLLVAIAPSVIRRAAVTSEEKSTCPGESIKLILDTLTGAKAGV